MSLYLIVHAIPARDLGGGRFAVESSFADHVRRLLDLLRPRFDRLVLAGVGMTRENYEQRKSGLGVLSERDGFGFVALRREGDGHPAFLRGFPGTLRRLNAIVAEAGLVHASYDQNATRPIEFPALLMAWAREIPTLGVIDIDYRNDPDMARATGRLSRWKYFVERRVYEPVRRAEISVLARLCMLLLVKEDSLVRDYDRPGRNVRFMLDPGFEAEHVMPSERLEDKLASLPSRPLEVIYFGRLVPYKGVDRMLEAVASAVRRGVPLRFTVMGVGPERPKLERGIEQLGLGEHVQFAEPVRYGPAFFERLQQADLLLAAPLAGDTPRSTWDALASGQAVLAFDTPFYRSMMKRTHAVTVVPWPDAEAMASELVALHEDRERLARMLRCAVEAARTHNQSAWLERRVAWTHSALSQRDGDLDSLDPASSGLPSETTESSV